MSDEKNDGNAIIKTQKTEWHRLLARLLDIVLSPLEIEVDPDVGVMTVPTKKKDVFLMRRNTLQWTAVQRARLPDAIRDSEASHILVELKYTQSFNAEALTQALVYDVWYKNAQQLSETEVQTVLLSAKEPHSNTLAELGYQPAEYPGVYRAQHPIIQPILLLSLNELSNEPHNVWIKCFSSNELVKKQALNQITQRNFVSLTLDLKLCLGALIQLWFGTTMEEQYTSLKLTAEEVPLSQEVREILLARLTLQELLAGLKPEEVLAHFMKCNPKEVLTYLKLEEVLLYLKPEEVFPYLKPEDVLADLEPEVIEEYLKQLKKQKSV
jgi:hypothetical protein